jgi:hypothetical protein
MNMSAVRSELFIQPFGVMQVTETRQQGVCQASSNPLTCVSKKMFIHVDI